MTNRTSTRRALLSSVMALLLCCTMLIGTTFAWFTDTASTNVNTIQAGTLDIALEDIDGNSLEGQSLSWQKAEGHENETVLWEPGCTYNLQPIVIKNNGNLALKYKVVITGIKGDAKLNEVIDWTIKIGDNTYSADSEFHLTAGQTNTLTISGHMQESAGNAYQGESIDGISITVYATQDTVEYDSNGNQYDANATYDIPWDGVTKTEVTKSNDGKYHITNAAQLVWLMDNTQDSNSAYIGETIVLDGNIDLGGHTVKGIGSDQCNFAGSFDGQGYTISNFVINNSRDLYSGLFNQVSHGGNIKNLTVDNATVIGNKMVGVIASDLENGAVMENCHVTNSTVISNVKKAGAVVGYTLSATVKDCTATNCTVYCANAAESGEIIGYVNDDGTTNTNNTSSNVTVVTGASYVSNGVMQQGNTYYIYNAQGLVYCAQNFTRSDNTINKIFKLTADIDMSGINWTPWCNEAQYFNGLFDGQNHTISNLTITDDYTAADGHAVGFIGRLGSNGLGQNTIQNVKFDNANVSGHHYVGVAVGYNEYGTVEKVNVTNSKVTATHVEGADSCGDKAGALIGMCGPNASYISVTNCSATNCEVKAARDAAQLIGYGYAGTVYRNLTATNVTVTAVAGTCAHERAGIVSANALIGNGSTTGLALS